MQTNLSFQTAALALLSLLTACGGHKEAGYSNEPQPYPVLTLKTSETTLYMDYPATVRGQQNIEIRPKVDGYVAGILVDEGATVKKGQLLFKINAPQYEQEVLTAQAAIKSAEAAVNTARMQVRKVTPLVKKEIVSNYELEAAELALQAREAELAQAKASLQNARVNLGYTTIYSPADGVIGTLPYKIGSLVAPASAQPLTVLADIANVHVYFSFTEKQLLDLAGTDANIPLDAKLKQLPPVQLVLANGNEYTEKGKVETTGGLINNGTGAISMRAVFPNKAGLIRSGSSATIRIVQPVSNALIVPAKAIYELQGKKFVYTIDSAGAAHSREITVSDRSSGDVYIVSNGLQAGDKIVADGIGSLKEGTKIKPVASAAPVAAAGPAKTAVDPGLKSGTTAAQ
ncbi:efflux RND transporter periplasmic adaptor subunit [Chitinophaga oryzae]|uniref:Efflux RND transporter periplasmic adaptor subunit n=1 Tax=Chitinophaga oryzae TaxID=2725414 RepID=A0AAE7D846_9BACT|nr:efflux RND transporter periplasmic adaptor subunit [Chitinophaga oryzae]QJB33032.1 efflux RND transporter periplasmic adaptor subunit [Chitinophaga oryzae]